jgi:hypothetical protein
MILQILKFYQQVIQNAENNLEQKKSFKNKILGAFVNFYCNTFYKKLNIHF